jgi:hypothetical protein
MAEKVGEALIIVKTKLDRFDKYQEDEKKEASDRNLATLLGIQQRAADAARQQDKLEAEALREQDSLAVEAARDQGRLNRQQEMQQHRDLMPQLIKA